MSSPSLPDLRAVNAARYCAKRPCAWRICRHHMSHAIIPEHGPMPSPTRVRLAVIQPHTCALDLAATGPLTLAQTGIALAMAPSDVRKAQMRAVRKVAKRLGTSVEGAIERLKGLSVVSRVATST